MSSGQLRIRGNLTATRRRATYTDLANGSSVSPSIAYTDQPTTGFFLNSTGLGITTLGAEAFMARSSDGQLIADDAWGLGNVNAANVVGNLSGVTSVTASGNVTGAFLIGNGAFLTGVSNASSLSQGTLDNARLPAAISVTSVAASNVFLSGGTASRVLSTSATGQVVPTTTSTTTLGYLDASSSVQTQLDGKVGRAVDTWHTSTDGNARMYFGNGGRSYFSSLNGFEWRYNSGTYSGSLDASGNFAVPGNMTAYSSDKRLKTNMRPICASALDAVCSLRGVRFEWTADAPEAMRGATDVSLLAQDVQAVLPEAVAPAPFDTRDDGESISGERYLTLKMHHQLTALLVEAVKELREELRACECRRASRRAPRAA